MRGTEVLMGDSNSDADSESESEAAPELRWLTLPKLESMAWAVLSCAEVGAAGEAPDEDSWENEVERRKL